MAAVVEIGGGYAFDAGELDGVGEQAGALHADADDAEADGVAGRDVGIAGGFEAGIWEEKRLGSREGAGGTGGLLQEFTP